MPTPPTPKPPATEKNRLGDRHIKLIVSHMFKICDHPTQAFIGARHSTEKPDYGPVWGSRFGLTFLFPK